MSANVDQKIYALKQKTEDLKKKFKRVIINEIETSLKFEEAVTKVSNIIHPQKKEKLGIEKAHAIVFKYNAVVNRWQ
jgi:hypothetical protein